MVQFLYCAYALEQAKNVCEDAQFGLMPAMQSTENVSIAGPHTQNYNRILGRSDPCNQTEDNVVLKALSRCPMLTGYHLCSLAWCPGNFTLWPLPAFQSCQLFFYTCTWLECHPHPVGLKVSVLSFKTLWKDCRLCNIISDTSDHSSHCALTSSRISTQRPVNLKSLYSRDLFFPPCSTVNEWCQPLHRKTNVVLLGEAFRRQPDFQELKGLSNSPECVFPISWHFAEVH